MYFLAEPHCIQGQAFKDSFGNFVQCGNGNMLGASICPKNYECHYDGNLWGCCPTKGNL